jgi:hypothetical protein
MSVRLHSMRAPFVLCRKRLKLSSDGGDSGNKKCKRGCGGAYGGIRRSLRLAGVWSHAISFVLVRLVGSRCEHSIYMKLNFINYVISMRFAKIMLQ